MKKCNKCGETKEVYSFRKNKSRKDGRQSECKECAKKRRTNATPCLYIIAHKVSGLYYLGQTTLPLQKRISRHFIPSQRSYFAGLNKNDWIIEALFYGTKDEVRRLERVMLIERVGIDPLCLNKNT